MRIILLLSSLMLMLGCSDDNVNLPDLTPRVQLLEANDKLQDSRLDALELRATSLEARLSQAEASIDQNASNISDLFDAVDGLDGELDALREQFCQAVRQLRIADRYNKRMLMMQMSQLRHMLMYEIYQRRLADNNLQDQIDDLNNDLNSLENQVNFNAFMSTIAFFYLNGRINTVQSNIDSGLANLQSILQGQIDDINSDINDINDAISGLGDLEDQVATNTANIDDLQNAVNNSSDCAFELRDVHTYTSGPWWNQTQQLRADVYVVCTQGEFRLANNQQLN